MPYLAPPLPFVPDEPFVPAPGLASPHAQTVFANFFRSRRLPPLVRRRFELPDGDFIDGDALLAPPEAPHVLVLHGLEGSSTSRYVAAALAPLATQGFGALALNFRSCSGEPNRLLRSYHADDTADVLAAARWLRARIQGPLLALGFSLGGNVLLKLLGELGDEAPLDAAVAVCPPFDLLAGATALDESRGFGAIYRLRFLRMLRRKVIDKSRRHPAAHAAIDLAAVRAARGIAAFDDAATARLHGFRDARDYYARSSCGTLVGAIRRPTLVLAALDDPIVPGNTIPREAIAGNPWLSLVLTEQGGHLGFVAGSPHRPRFWGDRQISRFLGREAAAATSDRRR